MADMLRVVIVTPDGDGNQLGTLTFDGTQIVADTKVAQGILDTVRRRSQLADPELFSRLAVEGFSNGQARLVR